jgi:hypothetical protein
MMSKEQWEEYMAIAAAVLVFTWQPFLALGAIIIYHYVR